MNFNDWVFAIALLGAGMLLGELAGWIVRASMSRPDRSRQVRDMARPVGSFLFWAGTAVGMALAVASASPESFEQIPDRLGEAVPDLLIAGLFLIGGYAISIGVAAAVGQSVMRATGVRHRGLERLLRVVIMGAALVLALSQMGIDTGMLVIVVAVLLGMPGLAIALLTGLGGRDVAANLAAGRSLKGQIAVGEELGWTDDEGREQHGVVVSVHPVSVAVLTPELSTVHVPMKMLLDRPFEIRHSTSETAS